MTRIAFTSDWHIDVSHRYPIVDLAKEYLKQQKVDILCFAGDMSANIDLSIKTLKEIEQDCRIKVCAVTGNHEMWGRKLGDYNDSWDVIDHFNFHAPTISVMENPYEFDNWVVLGNMGWYDYSTAEPYFTDKQLDKMNYNGGRWNDIVYCNWKGISNKEVANSLLDNLKDQLETYKNKNIILMSHVVPYKECVTVKHDKTWNYFNAFIGNMNIGKLADEYGVKIAHFGHTHFKWNKYSEKGVEMLCLPLGYSHEWSSDNLKDAIKKSIVIYDL